MFDIGMNEMIVILIIALIVIGPKQLPEVARTLAKGIAILRKARDELSSELRENIDLERHVSQFRSDIEKYIQDEAEKMKDPAGESSTIPASQPVHSPIQQQQEAEKASGQDTKEERSPQPSELLNLSEPAKPETEKADKACQAADSEHGEIMGEAPHG
jgi:sec-independent protein translocase protein TatB